MQVLSVATFPFQLIVAILVAIVLLCLVGVFLWNRIVNETSDFDPSSVKQPTPTEDKETLPATVDYRDTKQTLMPQTVSSADTINNQSDDDVVELKDKSLSGQKTVENAGDASISMDDEQE